MTKNRATKKTKKRNAGWGRRFARITQGWPLRLSAVVLVLSAVGGAGWWSWSSGWVARTAQTAERYVIDKTNEMGFSVREVLVVGRHETPRGDLLDAVGISRGTPILALDLEATRVRVEALPWVREVTVERRLPDTVFLRIMERRPLALWQYKNLFALVDTEGKVIKNQSVERFGKLLVVVGADAPANVPELFHILETQPALIERVNAAVRVGGRRWNLHLQDGIDVRLPEEDPASAWARLAEYERAHSILDRDVKILDLRIPGRVTVQTRSGKPFGAPAPGRET